MISNVPSCLRRAFYGEEDGRGSDEQREARGVMMTTANPRKRRVTSVEWQAGEDVAPLERVAAVIVAPVQGNAAIVAADLPHPTGSARAMRPRQNRHAGRS